MTAEARAITASVEGLGDFSDQEYLTRYFSYIAPPQGPLALNYVGPQPLALAQPSFYI